MDPPGWAIALLVVLGIWALLVSVLFWAGRALLARELALLVPNLVRLFTGLLRDGRVPLRAKLVLLLASLWLASPIDLIPEFIPIAGPLDDAIVAALALRFALRTTDVSVIREHWRGDSATLERLLRIVSLGRRGPPRAL